MFFHPIRWWAQRKRVRDEQGIFLRVKPKGWIVQIKRQRWYWHPKYD